MWGRRWIILLAAGYALAAVYRQAVRDDTAGELVTGWSGFLLFWAPAAILIGLGIAYAWPWVVERIASLRRRDR